jgi:DNA-binding NarL/FixJ family response regulator
VSVVNAERENPRILIVDDHPVVRTGVRMIVESDVRNLVVGEAGTSAEALEIAALTAPNVILLDLDLGGESGLDLLPDLLRVAPAARVIVLTAVEDTAVHRTALHRGALGLVRKSATLATLMAAIRKVHEGEAWFDRAFIGSVLSELSAKRDHVDAEAVKIASLSKREREVAILICRGLSNHAIADALFISEATVRHHVTSIYEKLAVAGRAELIVFAFRNGLATPPA